MTCHDFSGIYSCWLQLLWVCSCMGSTVTPSKVLHSGGFGLILFTSNSDCAKKAAVAFMRKQSFWVASVASYMRIMRNTFDISPTHSPWGRLFHQLEPKRTRYWQVEFQSLSNSLCWVTDCALGIRIHDDTSRAIHFTLMPNIALCPWTGYFFWQ